MTGGFKPSDVDTSRPHTARMYDFYLNGKDNYAADRSAAREVLRVAPEIRATVNRRTGRISAGRSATWFATPGSARSSTLARASPQPGTFTRSLSKPRPTRGSLM